MTPNRRTTNTTGAEQTNGRVTEPEIVYPYNDLEDRTIYEVVRRPPKNFKQRRPGPGDKTIWDLEGITRIPYRWGHLDHAADQGGIAWVVEGEKDADRLAGLGLTATTSAGGAAWIWPDQWAEHFRGLHRVVVIADNDPQGQAAAIQRAAVISQTVADVRIIQALPGVPAKGDVSDWLDHDGTLEDLVELAETAPTIDELDQPDKPKLLEVRWVTDAVDQPPPEPPVLIDGLIRVGELAVVGAPRAIGKSWLAMNLATLLGRGEGLFLGTLPIRRTARILIAQGELDEWGTSDRWRTITGTGAPPPNVAETFDRWRLKIVKRRASGHDNDTGWADEWNEAVLDGRLESTIVEHGFNVLIIDPWAVYYAGKENSNDETEAALDKLRDLAMRHRVALVIVHHLGKGTEAREPEDLWRGASRLADWASTRVTLLPHYTDRQAKSMGLTRRQARRYLDVHFLRRSTPTDDISIALNYETGWWERWHAPEEAAETRRIYLNPTDVAELCEKQGGDWPSVRKAAEGLQVSPNTATRLLAQAVAAGVIEQYTSDRGGTGHRLPQPSFIDDESWKDEEF